PGGRGLPECAGLRSTASVLPPGRRRHRPDTCAIGRFARHSAHGSPGVPAWQLPDEMLLCAGVAPPGQQCRSYPRVARLAAELSVRPWWSCKPRGKLTIVDLKGQIDNRKSSIRLTS